MHIYYLLFNSCGVESLAWSYLFANPKYIYTILRLLDAK